MLEVAVAGIGYLVHSGVLSQALPEAVKPIVKKIGSQFQRGTDDLQAAMRASFQQTLSVLGVGLNPSALQNLKRVTQSKAYQQFHNSFEEEYLRVFLAEYQLRDSEEETFRKSCAHVCRELLKELDHLLPPIDEKQIPTLLFPQAVQDDQADPLAATRERGRELMYEQLASRGIAGVNYQFLIFRDLLYRGVIFFFQEKMRENPRIREIFQTYQQHQIAVDMRTMQINVAQTQQLLLEGQMSLMQQVQELMLQMQNSPGDLALRQQVMDLQQQQFALIQDVNGAAQRLERATQVVAHLHREMELFRQQFADMALQIEQKLDTVIQQLDTGFTSLHVHLGSVEESVLQRIEKAESRLLAHINHMPRSDGAVLHDPLLEFEQAVRVALDDQVIEQNELRMLYAQAERWGISRTQAEEMIQRLAKEVNGQVLWTEAEQQQWERGRAASVEDSFVLVEEKLEQQLRCWLQGEKTLISESEQRRFFMEAALQGYPAERTMPLLQRLLKRFGARLESEARALLREYLAPSMKDRYLSANEAENVMFSAEQSGLTREQAILLIEEECIKHGCVNAFKLLQSFERFLQVQLTGAALPQQDAQRMIQWAISKGLREVEARSFLRKQCRHRNIHIVS